MQRQELPLPAETTIIETLFPPRAELLLRASRHPLASVVRRGLARAGVGDSERVLLLVSGGGDSMAMLLLVAALRERDDPSLQSLSVLAIDHGLRAEGAGEAAHAVAFAQHLGIARASSRAVVMPSVGNILDAARIARLDAARAMAAETGASAVLLAHQADDRAEGLLLALARGVGIDALASLLPRRDFDGGMTLCRPLLGARREELRSFLMELGVAWRDDPSNNRRARGEIRSDPSLAALADRIAHGADTLCDEAGELIALREQSLDSQIASGASAISRAAFEGLHHALRSAAIHRIVRAAGGDVTRATLEQALRAAQDPMRAPRSFDCGGGVVLVIDAREVRAITRA